MSISNARGFSVGGGINNVVHGNQSTINYFGDSTDKYTEVLATRVTVNAFHNSEQHYSPPNCHPGMCTEVLVKLSKWIEGNSQSTKIYWVYGPAGVGKSVIAQALAEKYASNQLVGSFFFSHNDSSSDKLHPFVATIAYQFLKSDALRERLGSFII
ncbi:hypothetical protein Moror_16922 [Moniliophthora roreri MCA 2997]|uniref:Nephrocystin 3-like N-terminal domain-containing protein n=1 Tax=Moniliophthora roreri (strain MCA 2997) TaxID=1381753 RepID=V2WND1_MONRO|nr:hypothetical protein Moror_16922 [Moniliophthora roreri MCA 2997]